MPEAISDQPTMCASLTTLRLTLILHLVICATLINPSRATPLNTPTLAPSKKHTFWESASRYLTRHPARFPLTLWESPRVLLNLSRVTELEYL